MTYKYFSLKVVKAGFLTKGSALNNKLKNPFSFWFSESGLCRAYLLYVDDERIWFFFPFGGAEIRSDYLSCEVSDYVLVMLRALAAWLAFVEFCINGYIFML